MPSGKPTDWSKYDQIIINELPTTTIVGLAHKLGLHQRSLGCRARFLGISPAPKSISVAHRQKISQHFSKPISDYQRQFVIDNFKLIPRKRMAHQLGISLYLVNNIMAELNLTTPPEVVSEALKQHAVKFAGVGAAALKRKLETDSEFAAAFSKQRSDISKALWRDDVYRLKVRNGIRRVYDDTDLRERLRLIGKDRYLNDPTVKAILDAPRPFKTSKLNDDVAMVLDGYNIQYQREVEICNYKFDFVIGNTLLEVNGDYWHTLPNNIKNDRAKSTIITTYFPNYQLKVIWEREFRSVRGKERLLELLGLFNRKPTVISLNDVEYNIVDNKLLNKFLASFHYLGQTNRLKHCYGAYLYGELIAVATFGQLVRQNIAKVKAIELTRLCRHPHFVNKNLMSQFLGWCCREIKRLGIYEQIISYADTDIHHGTIYKACNWQDGGLCQPDYQYLSRNGVPMHKKTLYNRAKAASMTEYAYVIQHNFQKVHTGQKRRFVLCI